VGENTDRSSQSEVLKKEKEGAKGADFLRGRGRGLILRYLHPYYKGLVQLKYIDTNEQVADGLTKAQGSI
jgi:hypothetical protein